MHNVLYKGAKYQVKRARELEIDKDALFMRVRYFDYQDEGVKVADPDQIEGEGDESGRARLLMLDEPIFGDCELEVVKFDDRDAQSAFWHSSAHILGYALEQVYEGAQLTIGPSTRDGFFYDFLPQDDRVVKDEGDYKAIEKAMKTIIGQNYPFEKLLVTKE